MALSWPGVCRGSALVLLCGMRPNGVTANLCTPLLASTRIRPYSPSKARLGLGRQVVTRLKWANEKYERFLQRRFPRFYILYHTFMRGFRLLFQDAKEISRIKTKMHENNLKFQQLPYREMEKLREFRRDMIKAIPLVLVSIPPFANYLVFVFMYLFPRQLLIRHFWTPEQQVEFQGVYHGHRARHHDDIIKGLTRAAPHVQNQRHQRLLLDLCNKVQSGAHPSVSEMQALRGLFSAPPLGLHRLDTTQMVSLLPWEGGAGVPKRTLSLSQTHSRQALRLLSCQLFLTPRLPGFLIRRRLNSHALELLQLDNALNSLGLHKLSDSELRQACYVRGLHSTSLSTKQCQEWLQQWLQLSSRLRAFSPLTDGVSDLSFSHWLESRSFPPGGCGEVDGRLHFTQDPPFHPAGAPHTVRSVWAARAPP
ncbi:hypothetical protein JZ751_009297 [Albula glossodonta]|uniref:Letm1 RBD domain-containing protein n=1 Tax=Albula glossodonta TaxID=121402 RepID=A0A8T2N5Y3_9TELE|nr:hypothetical protein JZ751_009297 [Albula glossodonta]